ncbi:hypothetical protein [Streptococcus intermedius]
MRWQKLFTASFEESLNLQDDKISGAYSQKAYIETIEVEQKRGRFKSNFIYILYSMLFVFGLNYLLVIIADGIFHTNPDELTLPISKINFLPNYVFYIGSCLWLSLIVIGKRISQKFMLSYRLHFHSGVTYLFWFYVETNLLFLTFFAESLTRVGTLLFLLLVGLIGYVIIRSRNLSLLELMYKKPIEKKKIDQCISSIIGFIFKYGWGFVLAGLLLKFIFPSSTGVRTDWIGYIGILAIWFILDIAIIAFETYLIFPYMLQGYYKWKYPEEYREWEGKTIEEWYGEKYLKKQEERKKRNGRK